MDEINVTVRVVIRRENGERYEYTKRLRERDLNPKKTTWANHASRLMHDAVRNIVGAITHEHGTPHDSPR